MRKYLANGLLLVGSLLLCLVVAEGWTRWADDVPLTALTLPPSNGGIGLDTTA